MFINENDKDRLLEVDSINEAPRPENTRNIIGAIADFFEQESELRDQVLATVFTGFLVDDILSTFRNLK